MRSSVFPIPAKFAMTQAIRRLGVPRLCNEALDDPLDSADKAIMMASAAKKLEELFEILRIDHRNDHNTRETPSRVARMYVEEMLRGRYDAPPTITEFDNTGASDQLIVTGPIELRSTCAHHLMPIYGSVIVGFLPSGDRKIIGLSKYDRIVDYFAARLQNQEELVAQIGDYIQQMTGPRGLAVRISAVHMCKTHRGVKASHASRMVNTAFYGEFRHDPELKRNFLQECMLLDAAK